MLNLLRIDNPSGSRAQREPGPAGAGPSGSRAQWEPGAWLKSDLVHQLGGGCLTDTPECGVVDRKRRVFYADDGIYEDLYVTDGSVLPRSLGVKSFI